MGPERHCNEELRYKQNRDLFTISDTYAMSYFYYYTKNVNIKSESIFLVTLYLSVHFRFSSTHSQVAKDVPKVIKDEN